MRAAFFSALAASVALAAPAEEPPLTAGACTGPSYDFIVVGSGPGGGPLASNLARAGYETLLIEAGDDESADIATQVAGLFVSTGIHDNLHWDFWVRNYDDDEQTKKFEHLTWKLPSGDMWVGPGSKAPEGAEVLGINYPRGATLGGSSIINAGAVFLPADSDWNYIVDVTGDKSWDAAHMRELFVKLEDNQYLPEGTPGHGFDGYLKTNIGDGNQFLASDASTSVLKSIVAELGKDPQSIESIITEDANFLSPARDQTDGLWALPFHSNKTWGRVSARNRILDTVKEKFPLKLQLNSLATRVLFDESGEAPKAVGVEFLEGKSVYKGDPRWDASKKGTLKTACAKKEVILSGGAYNSPQLLLLSGIGAKEHLKEHDIKVVVDLPGVGTNMQDNQEIGVFSLAKTDFYPAGDCTFGHLPDPCYDLWLKGEGPYTQAGPNSDILLLTTSHAPKGEHRDVTIFSGPFAFRGFWPATPNQTWVEPLNTWGMHMVKNFPQNRAGYVKLVSNDPTDLPEINFRLFTENPETDLGAMKEGIAFCRRALMRVDKPTGPLDITHPPCPAGVAKDGTCTDEDADEDWIKSDTFGHHVTSTNPIGADDDESAVLDSNFNVRGTKGLRVVDASVFPRIPGSFPVVATFMISEKASEVILAGLKGEMATAPGVETKVAG